MDATRLLERLCARHGLALDDARPLLPLVQRALVSPDDVRQRLLRLIEENLRRRADGTGEASLAQLEADLDEEVLRAVAGTLHGWEPSRRVREFGTDADPGSPDGETADPPDLPDGLGL